VCVCDMIPGWMNMCLRYRVAKTHKMPYLYRSFSAKEPYNFGLFLRKMSYNLRHSVGLRHPVSCLNKYAFIIAFMYTLDIYTDDL